MSAGAWLHHHELLQPSDVILILNHSMVPTCWVACNNGNGTPSLRLAGDGIECRCDLPNQPTPTMRWS